MPRQLPFRSFRLIKVCRQRDPVTVRECHLALVIKATAASTMYDMARVNANGYFDAENSADARYAKKEAMNAQRLMDYKNGSYAPGGGVVDPLPEDAPFFATYRNRSQFPFHPFRLIKICRQRDPVTVRECHLAK